MDENIKTKLENIAKNKGIDTSSLSDKDLARCVTGLLYGEELLEEDPSKAEWLVPGGVIASDPETDTEETQDTNEVQNNVPTEFGQDNNVNDDDDEDDTEEGNDDDGNSSVEAEP